MSAQPFRLPSGGRVDRARRLVFRFNGRTLEGHPGDTLAAALLANGVRVVGRSFKYHRPRGILSAGPEEPNALLRVGVGARSEPNTRATMQPLYEGLVAASQNHWPSLDTDLWRMNDLLSPLLPPGFYYKTFMRPARAWTTFYEKLIRRAAGMGAAPVGRDPDRYGHRFAHCDVLVVGAGPAGIASASAAAREGADVMLVDEREVAGGSLHADRRAIDGKPALEWIDGQLSALRARPNVRVMPCTTAFGAYDHHWVALAERIVEHHHEPGNPDAPRQRRWLVKTAQVVLATGAVERPIVFSGNDLPGVMLASAARRYVNEFGVLPGRKAVVFANNPDAYRTAFDLIDAGADVRAVVDAREDVETDLRERLRERGVSVLAGHAVVQARGVPGLRAVEIRAIDALGRAADRVAAVVECDLLCMSGGFSPSLHLHSQAGGKIRYDPALAAFVPIAPGESMSVVGAASGARDPDVPWSIRPLWRVLGGGGKQFVDFQDDVTVGDLLVALRENYSSIEHIKRYTTLGMGTDQGKTSNLNGLAIVALESGRSIPEVGTTTFRPPYTPVALGVLAGTHVHAHLDPVRRSPLHEWHQRSGAAWMPAGLWMRPRAYPRNGERLEQAIRREVSAVRQAVGLCDMSTLGKIDVQGPDAEAFLSRVYCNAVEKVAVGRCRYGLMLRDDGIVLDDGTVARLGQGHYYLTSTTGNAAKVMSHLEFLSQVTWPDMRVRLTSVAEQFAQIVLAGRQSRIVLERAAGRSLGDEVLPHVGHLTLTLFGIEVRVFRVSFSGELAYEMAVPAEHAESVWSKLLEAGAAQRIQPYGIEAVTTLRIEKGHVAHAELDGRCTPADLGLERFVSKQKSFVGRALLQREALRGADRKALVGLTAVDPAMPIPSGAQLVLGSRSAGHVTSSTVSPTLERSIGLGMLEGGMKRLGERVTAASPLTGQSVPVTVTSPHFYDPEGARLRG